MRRIATLMTDKLLLRARMIRECDIALRTEWEVSTVPTDPGTSRTATVIEDEDSLIPTSRTCDDMHELIGYESAMKVCRPKWNERDRRCSSIYHRKII